MHIRLGRGDAPRGWLCLKMVWGRVWSRRAGRSTGYRAGCRVSNATDLLGLKRSLCCCPGTFLASQTPTVRVFHYHCHPAAPQPAGAHLSPAPIQPSRERCQPPLSTCLNSLLHLVVWLVHWMAAVCVMCLIESIKPLLGSIVMIISFDLSSFPSSPSMNLKINFILLLFIYFFRLFSTLVEMFTQAFVFHPLSSLSLYPPSDRKTRPGSEIPNNGL